MNTKSKIFVSLLATLVLLYLGYLTKVHFAWIVYPQANKVQKNKYNNITWIETLWLKEKKYFSQNNEDGVIEEVFNQIGLTDKIYVEFGVESCVECNTRFLR